MNDPHVKALIYVVGPNDSVDYGDANLIKFEPPGFHVRLQNGHARFELTEHYPTEPEARAAVQPVIDQWIFEASVKSGQSNFNLRFGWSEIIDRRPDPPTPGVKTISAHFPGSPGSIAAAVSVSKQYPPPPSEAAMDLHNPHVRAMFDQYVAYRSGRDLPVVAQICCEEFSNLRVELKESADRLNISNNLIDRVRHIANTEGGPQARHAIGLERPLTQCKVRLLEKAIVAMIVRAAKVAADPNQNLEEINLGNLMEISP